MILQANSPFSYEYLQELGSNSKLEIFNEYNCTQTINYTDLANLTVTYNENFLDNLYNKIPDAYLLAPNSIFEKVIQFNYLRNLSNNYTKALNSDQIAFGSVVTFGF